MTVTSCTHRGCLRVTKDPSSRCHDHRGSASRATTPSSSLPAPSVTPIPTVLPDYGDDPPTRTEVKGGTVHDFWDDPDGRAHREGAPASIARSSAGVVLVEAWIEHGLTHRRGGPAITTRYETGEVATEFYQVRNQWHRIDGPASASYGRDGTRKTAKFYVDGVEHRDAQEIGKTIRRFPELQVISELRNSSFSVLLDEGHGHLRIVQAMSEGLGTVEGLRAYLTGTPLEWARAYEEGAS